MTGETYHFRPVTPDDFPRLRRWLEKPHVARWWPDAEAGVAEIAAGLEEPGFAAYLVHVGGRPFAYLQVYDPFAEPGHPYRDQPIGSRGLDTIIGVSAMRGRGHGPGMLRAMAERLFAAGAPRLLIDPDPANERAIRAYEKAGFRHLGVRSVVFADGQDAVAVALMARDRKERRDDDRFLSA